MNEKPDALTRRGVTHWCGKRVLHLLPQPAGFASNVSQMQCTGEYMRISSS